MSDNGCQPTSVAFMRACATLEIHQTFTSDNNPWLQEWRSPFTLISALERWIDDYNAHYLHSALGYKPPRQFEREYHLSHGTPFVAA